MFLFQRPSRRERKLHLRTEIVFHPKEKLSKCSAWPLRNQPGFIFRKFPAESVTDRNNLIRLDPAGQPITECDANCNLLLLDGTWRYVEQMAGEYQDIPTRRLGPWKTACPRKSKLFTDPAAGLATAEAIYAAFMELGRNPHGILDNYQWREAFLKINRQLIVLLSNKLTD
jgi:rRNA small subunit aminocarboxypropyltransferase